MGEQRRAEKMTVTDPTRRSKLGIEMKADAAQKNLVVMVRLGVAVSPASQKLGVPR